MAKELSGLFILITMELSLLCLMDIKNPPTCYFNDCGVLIGADKIKYSTKNIYVSFSVASINGIWGGAMAIMGKTWGYMSPIVREDFKFRTLNECIENLWCSVKDATNNKKEYTDILNLYKKWKNEK